jgi:hypothetical protein
VVRNTIEFLAPQLLHSTAAKISLLEEENVYLYIWPYFQTGMELGKVLASELFPSPALQTPRRYGITF